MAFSVSIKRKLFFTTFFVFVILFMSGRAILAQVPANIRIGIITPNEGSQYRSATAVSFTVKGNYQVIDLSSPIPGDNLIGTPREGESWQVYYLPTGMQIYQNGQPLKITSGPVVVKEVNHDNADRVSLVSYSVGATITPIGRNYRGNMEFRLSGNSLTTVNELPTEEYLYGVVPREMSYSWPLEALKAQAVAARTYTAANYSKRAVEGFNLLDTPYDQAYGGISVEGENSSRAVRETAGQIILYKGAPISAVYHSNSGGHTENNENVWTGPALDYLRGKEDIYSTTNGYANWSFTTDLDNVKNQLQLSGSQIGSIQSIQLEKYSSGRVENVIITDINGNNISMTGTAFGHLFNPKFYATINNTSFMSNFFAVNIENVTTPSYSVLNGTGEITVVNGSQLYSISEDGNTSVLNGSEKKFFVIDAQDNSSHSKIPYGSIVFQGHGWGHGVGMSQWGAYEMAKQGKGYLDILKFYYTGVEVTGN
jgi:stage II sporulation protein D